MQRMRPKGKTNQLLQMPYRDGDAYDENASKFRFCLDMVAYAAACGNWTARHCFDVDGAQKLMQDGEECGCTGESASAHSLVLYRRGWRRKAELPSIGVLAPDRPSRLPKCSATASIDLPVPFIQASHIAGYNRCRVHQLESRCILHYQYHLSVHRIR
jgi:hypothetical protein